MKKLHLLLFFIWCVFLSVRVCLVCITAGLHGSFMENGTEYSLIVHLQYLQLYLVKFTQLQQGFKL